ncbi:MAG: hypothetical protein K0M40_07715 [Prolixibacteraceae bacterium]|nr:hypothetical protein [Prolixibacteraceae bacterium]
MTADICRLPLGNGHKSDIENRPRESLYQGNTQFSDGIESGFKKVVS